MKADLLDLNGSRKGGIELPEQFSEEYRPDLIKRAVHAVQSHKRQPYGSMEEAGERPSSKVSRRRRDYRGSYGKGISRVQRKILSRHGSQMHWVGATAPGMVSGRRAHPPKASKDWSLKINITERKKAIRSAIAATALRDIVARRGHRIGNSIPIVVDAAAESISKAKDVVELLKKLGLVEELKRLEITKVRAGKGKARGRKHRTKVGPLFVVSGKCPLQNAAANIPGTDIATVESLNAELLAPGTHAGRLTIWTGKAIDRMANESLFMVRKR